MQTKRLLLLKMQSMEQEKEEELVLRQRQWAPLSDIVDDDHMMDNLHREPAPNTERNYRGCCDCKQSKWMLEARAQDQQLKAKLA